MMEWICTEARLPNPEHDGESFLVYVSGKPQENITLIGVIMTAEYSPEDGWVSTKCRGLGPTGSADFY